MSQPVILTRLDVLKHRLDLSRLKFSRAKDKGDAYEMNIACGQFEGIKAQLERAGVRVETTIWEATT